MKDPKGARRKYLGYIEMQRMIARYPIECKELVHRKETEEEKKNKRKAQTYERNAQAKISITCIGVIIIEKRIY